ncbi:MAG: glutamyl-tRNA reductase [Chloroflexota bacterium]|nr:glutamyl-tRNA reductase [Chloroflexota bacterium]MDQ5865473.1 glutamyl-tRNA reductase [Chloroflexota bacterium]
MGGKTRRNIAATSSSIANIGSLSVLGVNHNTAPLAVREHFALSGDRLLHGLHAASNHAAECVILSTCNRLETYALQHQHHDPYATLTCLFDESASQFQPYTYRHDGSAAAKHLFTVASGVDSLVLGEVQILGQVQRAWQAAHQAGAVGPVLSQLFHKAVALGKRVHSETPISRRPASVSYAAVMLAKQIFGGVLHSRRVLVIGTGEVGEGVTRCLHEHGVHATVVAHRQLDRAHDVARRYDAEVALWEDLPEQLGHADIVISSTSAPHTILQHQQIEAAMRHRENRPLYLVDLAVPRDIDPAASDVPGVHLHNIDDLQEVVRTTLQEREMVLPTIRAMIDVETVRYAEWLRARAAAPTIQQLRAQAESVTQGELQWAMPKLRNLTPREQQVVEAMAARIAGKLLHGPIQWLKAQALEGIAPEYTIDALGPQELADMFYVDTGDSEAEVQG